jgi:hypothetical protein
MITLLKEKINELEREENPLQMRLKLINHQIKKQTNSTKKLKLKTLLQRKHKIEAQVEKVSADLAIYKQHYSKMQNEKPDQSAGDFWFITEKKFTKKEAVVPENCIMICLNPKTVDHIANWSFALPTNFVALPKIMLKDRVETSNVKRKQSVTRSSYKSELNAIDHSIFHETRREETKFEKGSNVRVALVR